jgi:PAS domain-containing protein
MCRVHHRYHDRKNAEERLHVAAERLQELEERQRMALDAAELGTWKHDVFAGRVELDSRARAHYGVDAEVVEIDEILARVYPDDAPNRQRAMAAALDPHVNALSQRNTELST